MNILSLPVGRNVSVDKSNTGTSFFEQLAMLRVVPTTLLQAKRIHISIQAGQLPEEVWWISHATS